ncbi:hypothetical protein LZ30DRAFT_654519 [Colletotrichum cereale]|nr:hypothetical protein LZ30DRAFT_654519 [Colletotrichum cereale]
MALPPPPDGLDLGESRVYEITSALAASWSLAVIAVSLRFLARHLKQNKLWWEDWVIVIQLGLPVANMFANIVKQVVPNGTGKHIWVGPPVATKAWAIGLFVSEVAYTLTLGTVKFSTLLFYWRIFSARKSIKIPIWVLFSIVLSWCIAVLLVTIFQCVPTHAFWDRYDPVNPMSPTQFYCGVNINMFFNGNSIPNIITDAFIVMLPIPYVLSLQMQRPQKFALVGVFLLGTFVTVISIVRLHLILAVDLKSPDITWNFCDAIIWTNVEANTAIVCACLPSLKPLLSFVINGTLDSSVGKGDGSGNSGGSYMLSDGARYNARRGSRHIKDKGDGPDHGQLYVGSAVTGHTTVQGSCPNHGNSYLGSKAASQVAVKGSRSGNEQDDERPITRLSEQESNSSIEEARYKHDAGGKPVILISKDFEVKSISRNP